MRPHGFHHLAIQVRDLPRAERFYTEVLGLPVLRRWPWPPEELARGRTGERALWLALGATERDGFVALEASEGAERLPPPFHEAAAGLHLLALRIAPGEREAWEERLRALGVAVAHRSRWTTYVMDPEGNRIGLSHHPDE